MREQEINTEGGVFIIEVRLELGDLFAEHVRSVANTSNDTQSTGVGDSGSELWAGSYVHARQQDGMWDIEEVSDRCAELLCEFRFISVLVLYLF